MRKYRMKKHLSSILFGALGFCAGAAICYTYFVLPGHHDVVRRPSAEVVPHQAASAALPKENGSLLALAGAPDILPEWPREFWQQPEAATPAPATNDGWRSFAIPMPQPPEDSGTEDWSPGLILPMIPPKIFGHPGAEVPDWQPKLIVPTIPPQILDHNFPDGR